MESSRGSSAFTRTFVATRLQPSGDTLADRSHLQAVLGHGTISVIERYGTISDDLVEREAMRLEAQRQARQAK